MTDKKKVYRRFLPKNRLMLGEIIPPFLMSNPYEVRDGISGYLVPCFPDHPDAELVEKSIFDIFKELEEMMDD